MLGLHILSTFLCFSLPAPVKEEDIIHSSWSHIGEQGLFLNPPLLMLSQIGLDELIIKYLVGNRWLRDGYARLRQQKLDF